MNKNQIEYYIGDIGYLVNDLIESKEKRKEILTHLREFSNSGNTEKAISYLADELVLPVVQVFFINSHDNKGVIMTKIQSFYCKYVPALRLASTLIAIYISGMTIAEQTYLTLLKEKGTITEEEFSALKIKVISDYAIK